MTNLQKRVLAALIYFPLLLLSTWSLWSFALVLSFCVAVSWYEYLSFLPKPPVRWVNYFWIVAGTLPLAFLVFSWSPAVAILVLGLLWQLSIMAGLLQGRSFTDYLARAQFLTFGFLYITGLFFCLGVLQKQPGGREALWFLLFVVGAADTGAYFVGKSFGRKSFFSAVSPSKTREGFIGGLLAGMLVALVLNFLFDYFDFHSMSYWKVALVGLGVAFFSSFGDLVESMIKRNFGVKDSGKIIAGHGGVLDRFDGVIFAGLPLLFFVSLNGGFGF